MAEDVRQFFAKHPLPGGNPHGRDGGDDCHRAEQDECCRGQTRYHRVATAPAPQPGGWANRPRQNRPVAQEPAQLFRQLLGAGVAFGRLLLQAFQNNGLQIPRRTRVQRSRQDRLHSHHLPQSLEGRVRLKWRPRAVTSNRCPTLACAARWRAKSSCLEGSAHEEAPVSHGHAGRPGEEPA